MGLEDQTVNEYEMENYVVTVTDITDDYFTFAMIGEDHDDSKLRTLFLRGTEKKRFAEFLSFESKSVNHAFVDKCVWNMYVVDP